MKNIFTFLALLIFIITSMSFAQTTLSQGANVRMSSIERAVKPPMMQSTRNTGKLTPNKMLTSGSIVNFDNSLSAGADFLLSVQSITNFGWDWNITPPFVHAVSTESNLYGTTGLGLYYAYLESNNVTYKNALQYACDQMVGDATIADAGAIKLLLLFQDLPGVIAGTYQNAAKAKYDADLAAHGGTATSYAQYIRDDRGVTQGYKNGIIPWDIGAYATAAKMLYNKFGGTYNQDAIDIAEVIYQDSYNTNPGFFEPDGTQNAGWDPTYTNTNYYWYTLGITGIMDAFVSSGTHADKLPGLITILNACKFSTGTARGAYSYCYGANTNDDDWQTTAYVVMSLANYNQATYQTDINSACFYLATTQDPTYNAWMYSGPSSTYPEIDGECSSALYFGTKALTEYVDAAYTSTSYGGHFWDYDAFSIIQDAVDAAAVGATINVAAGTYDGFSVVGKSNLTLHGAGVGSTIINPTTLITTGIGHKYDANMAAFVFVNTSTNIVINGMTIQSNSVTPGIGAGFGNAIVFWNASTGQINNCEIKGMYTISGMQTGQGIAVDAGSGQTTTLALTNTVINGFQKNGIDAVDGNGSTSNPGTITLTVNGCTITGAGPTSAIAQNGILFWKMGGGSVTGTVENTKFANIWYSLPSNDACGILAYDIMSIHNSFFDGVQIGVDNEINPVVVIDATENWWGNATGPYDNKTLPNTPNYNNPSGLGSAVTPYVAYEPWNTLAPVELSTFTSTTNGRNVQLNWETKTEKNSYKFDIEREVSGANWESICSVKAAVLSNSPKQYSFTDKNLQAGKYQYRLKMIDNDGSFEYSKIVETEVTSPKNFELSQNYPNPFNPSTRIDYQVPVDAKVILEVYNIAGQKVVELVNQEQSAGYYTVDFGASKLSSGVYIYRIVASDKATGNNFSSIKKMMLLK